MLKMMKSTKRGFTLIELLVVIAIIAVLAVIVFVALDPARRFADTRNSRRVTDVNNILTAVHTCIVDNGGLLVPCLGTLVAGERYEIVTGATAAACDDVCTGVTSDTHCAALDTTLAAKLKSIPVDPGGVAAGHTEYTIDVDANNIITIAACSVESGATVQVSR